MGWRRMQRVGRFGLLSALILMTTGSGSGAPATGTPPLRITFLSLDRGEATLLRLPGGLTGMIGAGAAEDAPTVSRTLRRLGIKRLDFLVISSWAPENLGGVPVLLREMPVRQLFHNPLYAPGKAGEAVLRVARERERQQQLSVISASMETTTVFFSPPCQIRNVGPIGTMYQKFAGDPRCSLVVEVDYDHFSFLSLGDTRQQHQRELWKVADPAPSGQLLQISRCGAKDSLLPSLLKPLGTRVAVLPLPRKAGTPPSGELLKQLQRGGVRTYRTDRDGTVTVTTDGRTVHVKTEP